MRSKKIDLKCPEMRSKVNFRYPKWPTAAILSTNFKKIKLRIDLKLPEMPESEFRTSKITAGGHFVKQN